MILWILNLFAPEGMEARYVKNEPPPVRRSWSEIPSILDAWIDSHSIDLGRS